MSKFVKTMPWSGDTPILVAINALANHGMTLIRGIKNFQGGCMTYNIIQIRHCCWRVVIVRLWDLKSTDYSIDRCAAWARSIIQDFPKSVGLNNSSDNATSTNSKAVFE